MFDAVEMLKELGKTASEHSAKTLSGFLGKNTRLRPSFAEIIPVHEIYRNMCLRIEDVGIVVFSRLHSGIQGEMIFVLDEKNAFRLLSSVSPGGAGLNAEMNAEMGISTLKEIGHIIIGSYLSALSEIIRQKIVPAVPTLLSGTLATVFADVIYFPYAALKQIQRYYIQNDFEVLNENVIGNICMAISCESGEIFKNLLLNRKPGNQGIRGTD